MPSTCHHRNAVHRDESGVCCTYPAVELRERRLEAPLDVVVAWGRRERARERESERGGGVAHAHNTHTHTHTHARTRAHTHTHALVPTAAPPRHVCARARGEVVAPTSSRPRRLGQEARQTTTTAAQWRCRVTTAGRHWPRTRDEQRLAVGRREHHLRARRGRRRTVVVWR